MDTIVYLSLSFKQLKISVWDIVLTLTFSFIHLYSLCSHKSLKFVLDLFVECENEGTSSTSDDVREATLEESKTSFFLVDLGKAIHGTVVELLTLSRSHHKSSSHGIKWVGDDTS